MIGEFITRIFSNAGGSKRDPLDDFWYDQAPITIEAESFSPDAAKQLGAVQDSLAALADPISTLPLHIYRRNEDGSRTRVDHHPLKTVLSKRANSRNTSCEFLSFMQYQLGWHKNALAKILPGELGAVSELQPIDWGKVRVVQDAAGVVFYRRRMPGGGEEVLRQDEVLHLRAAPFDDDCLCGIPIYKTGAATLAYALSVHKYGSRFFKNSGKSGGVIKLKAPFKSPDDRDKFIAAWNRAGTGANQHKDRILENEGDYVTIEVKNNEAQFRESKADANRACGRLWRMPPHMIGDLENAHFKNIEEARIEFVQEILLPWLIIWEQAIARDLILDDQYYAEFDIAGLLRGDLKSRFEAYAKAVWTWITVNEIRKRENLPPVEGGDVLLTPLNMTADYDADDDDEKDEKKKAGDGPGAKIIDWRKNVLTAMREEIERKAA